MSDETNDAPLVRRKKLDNDPDTEPFRHHSYYNIKNALQFLELIKAWKDRGCARMGINAELFNLKVNSLRLRFRCAKIFLQDNPQLYEHMPEISDAIWNVQIGTKNNSVTLQNLGKIDGHSLMLAMAPIDDSPRAFISIEEELNDWIASVPAPKEKKVFSGLRLSPEEVRKYQTFLHKLRHHYTGVVNETTIIFIRLNTPNKPLQFDDDNTDPRPPDGGLGENE